MDNKNVFIAIALSMSVLLFWAMFVEAPKPQQNELIKEKVQKQSVLMQAMVKCFNKIK